MTHITEHYRCDHPGCTATLTAANWSAGVRAGWSGYWTDLSNDAELRHHCPDHPVPIRLGEPLTDADFDKAAVDERQHDAEGRPLCFVCGRPQGEHPDGNECRLAFDEDDRPTTP